MTQFRKTVLGIKRQEW